MVRESFNEQLNQLRNDILLMGKMVGNAIELSIEALKRQDLDLAQQVVMDDEKIDRLELAIERGCLSLLALQQPMARDLRFIGTALKINTDLERMGDYASNIAKVVLSIGNEPFIKPLIDIPLMADLAQVMVRENLTAYVNQDRDMALKAAMHDHDINNYYTKVFNELLELMTRDSRNIKQATYFLFIARYLERIGDHATNLSEWIIYMITGERLELNES
ncbi:MAG: phosphate signaling complex protein PhoU [Desulfotomaculaceae bacterium]